MQHAIHNSEKVFQHYSTDYSNTIVTFFTWNRGGGLQPPPSGSLLRINGVVEYDFKQCIDYFVEYVSIIVHGVVYPQEYFWNSNTYLSGG